VATTHASSGGLIDLRPLRAPLDDSQSTTLLRDDRLKIMRLVMPAGKAMHDHAVDGPIAMPCREGVIEVAAHGISRSMRAGDLLYLASKVPYSLRAIEDPSAALVTLAVERPAASKIGSAMSNQATVCRVGRVSADEARYPCLDFLGC
jgi:quercetin dioxygenase-like cupin family protein